MNTTDVKSFVSELFQDGKSPLSAFGTSWEQLVELEKKIEGKEMTLNERIKAAQLQNRKEAAAGGVVAKIQAKLLTTVIGESQIDGKECTDGQLERVLLKFLKNVKETIAIKETAELIIEKSCLESFLPRFVTSEEVTNILTGQDHLNKGQKMAAVKVFCRENNLVFDGPLVNSLT